MIINSRADLEALRDGPEFLPAMTAIYGASQYWGLVNDEWVLHENPSAYEQFGFTSEQFLDEVAGLQIPAPTSPAPAALPSTDQNIVSAPSDLFGGPTLKEVFDGN